MERFEWAHILGVVILMFVVWSVGFSLDANLIGLIWIFGFSFVVVILPILAKNALAYYLDANVTHEIWSVYRFGFKPREHFKKPVLFGLILPLVFSLISLGFFKMTTFLTYETRALKYRAARKFGHYSYTSMTDWHNALIGALGVFVLLVISVVGYLTGFEVLTKMAAYYAFWNMIPISKLDGTQIYFGSRVLWTVLGALTLVFSFYAFLL